MGELPKQSFVRGNQDVDTSILALEMVWAGFSDRRIQEQAGVSVPNSFLEVIKGRTINYFVSEKKFNLLVERSTKEICGNKNLLEFLKKKTLSISNESRNYAIRILNDLEVIKEEEIASVLGRIKELQVESSMHGVLMAWCDVNGGITNQLLEIISKRKGLKYSPHTYLSVLGSPTEKSLTEKAYEEIHAGNKTDEELLKEYFWLNQGYIGRDLTKEELDRIKSLKREEGTRVSKSELRKELNLTALESYLFDVYREVIFCKSFRADSRQFLYVVLNKLVDILSKKWGVEPNYIEALYSEEIIDVLLNKKAFPSGIKDRFNHSVILPNNRGDYDIKVGQAAEDYVKSRLVHENIIDNKILKGQVAHPGVVKGAIKLIFGPQHMDKVEEGDILVSTSTSPQLLPVMKIASAFITDVGGITSHAAIVSRELRKPCIVGTKFATQVLKDGDLVEVDANKGIIRRIND